MDLPPKKITTVKTITLWHFIIFFFLISDYYQTLPLFYLSNFIKLALISFATWHFLPKYFPLILFLGAVTCITPL